MFFEEHKFYEVTRPTYFFGWLGTLSEVFREGHQKYMFR